MARQILTKTEPAGQTAGVALVFTAEDTGNHSRVLWEKGLELFAWNTHASTTYNATITSAPDKPAGRTKDIAAENIVAGAIHRFGPFDLNGWKQADGYIYLQASNAAVKFAALKRGR